LAPRFLPWAPSRAGCSHAPSVGWGQGLGSGPDPVVFCVCGRRLDRGARGGWQGCCAVADVVLVVSPAHPHRHDAQRGAGAAPEQRQSTATHQTPGERRHRPGGARHRGHAQPGRLPHRAQQGLWTGAGPGAGPGASFFPQHCLREDFLPAGLGLWLAGGPGQRPWGQAARQERGEAAVGGCSMAGERQAWASAGKLQGLALAGVGTAQAEPPCAKDSVPSAASPWEKLAALFTVLLLSVGWGHGTKEGLPGPQGASRGSLAACGPELEPEAGFGLGTSRPGGAEPGAARGREPGRAVRAAPCLGERGWAARPPAAPWPVPPWCGKGGGGTTNLTRFTVK